MRQKLLLLRFIVQGSYRYLWWSLKEFIKRLIGRAPYHDRQQVFFRKYILHLMGICPIRAITCIINESNIGPGGQAFLIMKTISFARACGLTYLHTPFMNIARPELPMQEWDAAWETTFNLGAGEIRCEGKRKGVIDYYGLVDLELCFGWFDRKEQLDKWFKALIPEFRRKYYLNKSAREMDELTVAVHIRRGDVSAEEYSYMYTSAEKIFKMASTVKALLDSHGMHFKLRVYGQGETEEFADLSNLGAEFFLNADALWAMQELVEADILILAKSHFSYYAGLVSDGIKVFEPCGIPMGDHTLSIAWRWMLFSELDDWLPCQSDGAVDRAAFERQLFLLMRSRSNIGKHEPSPAGSKQTDACAQTVVDAIGSTETTIRNNK